VSKREWITAATEGVPAENLDAVNEQLNSNDGTFFVSYVASMGEARKKFGVDAIWPPSWGDGEETCLVVRQGPMFGIPMYLPLPGDHREAYEAIIDNGLAACHAYYRQQTASLPVVSVPVICDMSCNQDWTNRPESGGFVMDSNGVCPDCAPRLRADLTKYGELDHIKKECPPDMSYADFIREVRRNA
jgi:hypothetical protein